MCNVCLYFTHIHDTAKSNEKKQERMKQTGEKTRVLVFYQKAITQMNK